MAKDAAIQTKLPQRVRNVVRGVLVCCDNKYHAGVCVDDGSGQDADLPGNILVGWFAVAIYALWADSRIRELDRVSQLLVPELLVPGVHGIEGIHRVVHRSYVQNAECLRLPRQLDIGCDERLGVHTPIHEKFVNFPECRPSYISCGEYRLVWIEP